MKFYRRRRYYLWLGWTVNRYGISYGTQSTVYGLDWSGLSPRYWWATLSSKAGKLSLWAAKKARGER